MSTGRILSLLAAMTAGLMGACASRPLHPDFAAASAASPEAAAPAPANVAISLEADPPLPGEPTEGWLGLEAPPDDGTSPHEGHGGHGGHGAHEGHGHAH
jgi:hypothetical protein